LPQIEEIMADNREEEKTSPSPLTEEKAGKNKKNAWWRFLSAIIIVIGILFLLSPFIGRLYNAWQEKQLLSSFADEEESVYADDGEYDKVLEELEVTEEEESAVAEEEKGVFVPAYKPNIIGSINIPRLDLIRPIADNVSKKDLRKAIGKVPGSANIGDVGNVCLAGHRNYAYKVFFDDLDKLQTGDEIILESNKGVFVYRVYEKLVVMPTDSWVMAGDGSRRILTLITCDPPIINNKRLIYKAELSDPPPPAEEDNDASADSQEENGADNTIPPNTDAENNGDSSENAPADTPESNTGAGSEEEGDAETPEEMPDEALSEDLESNGQSPGRGDETNAPENAVVND
jgi:sortase A